MGNAVKPRKLPWGWVEFHGNTAGMVPSVRYYHGNGNASAVIPLERYYRGDICCSLMHWWQTTVQNYWTV